MWDCASVASLESRWAVIESRIPCVSDMSMLTTFSVLSTTNVQGTHTFTVGFRKGDDVCSLDGPKVIGAWVIGLFEGCGVGCAVVNSVIAG